MEQQPHNTGTATIPSRAAEGDDSATGWNMNVLRCQSALHRFEHRVVRVCGIMARVVQIIKPHRGIKPDSVETNGLCVCGGGRVGDTLSH